MWQMWRENIKVGINYHLPLHFHQPEYWALVVFTNLKLHLPSQTLPSYLRNAIVQCIEIATLYMSFIRLKGKIINSTASMQKHKAHTVKVLDLLDAFRIAVSDGLHRQACRSSDLKTKTKSPRDMQVTMMRWIKGWQFCTMKVSSRWNSKNQNRIRNWESCQVKLHQDVTGPDRTPKCSCHNDKFCESFTLSKVVLNKLNEKYQNCIPAHMDP